MKTQMAVVFLSLSVVSSLLFGGLVHAMTPHDHESEIVWTTLHAAVRHENSSVSVIASSGLIVLIGAVLLSIQFILREAPPGKLDDALRRGVVAYRRFG